jgi:hypothetical protein
MVGWRYNCNITKVWGTNTTAWVYIASPGTPGWRELAASTIDMFNAAVNAKFSGKLANIYEDASNKITIIALP